MFGKQPVSAVASYVQTEGRRLHLMTTLNSPSFSAFEAVRANNFAQLSQLDKSKLLERDHYGQTPLHIAAKLGHVECVDYLLRYAPETQDIITHHGENPALIAAGVGEGKCVERLLEGNLKISLLRALHRDMNGTSSLMASVVNADNDLAFWLLRRFGKALAMQPNNYDMLPLHVAAAKGNIEFVRIVTKYDSRMVNMKDKFGFTPVFYAVQGGHIDCFRYLTEKTRADISLVSSKGHSLLQIACLANQAHIVQWILYHSSPTAVLWCNKENATCLHCISYSGDVDIMKMLLGLIPIKRRRESLLMRDSRGNTPLHLATFKNNIHMIAIILQNGGYNSIQNAIGETAVTIANSRGHSQLIRIFSDWNEKRAIRSLPMKLTPRANTITGGSSGYGSIASEGFLSRSPRFRRPYKNSNRQSGDLSTNANEFLAKCKQKEELDIHPMYYIASDEGGRLYVNGYTQTDKEDSDLFTRYVEVIHF